MLKINVVGNIASHFEMRTRGEQKYAIIRIASDRRYTDKDNSPIMFHRVQEEMARRSNKRSVTTKTKQGKFSGKYALTERLVCGECGSAYRRCTWSKNGKKRIVWRCVSRLEHGTKYCKHSPTLDEERIHTAIAGALGEMVSEKEFFMQTQPVQLHKITQTRLFSPAKRIIMAM